MATAAVCLARGIDPEAVAGGLRSFQGVAHRLEPLGTHRGVVWINDSKATNVASTLVALRSYSGGVHLIAGGRGKNQDFSPLAPLVAERCVAVYLIGEAAGELEAALSSTGLGSNSNARTSNRRPGEGTPHSRLVPGPHRPRRLHRGRGDPPSASPLGRDRLHRGRRRVRRPFPSRSAHRDPAEFCPVGHHRSRRAGAKGTQSSTKAGRQRIRIEPSLRPGPPYRRTASPRPPCC